jgi:hypothetical protein
MHQQFIGSVAAAKALGVNYRTLRRRIERGELETFRDPLNDKRRLVRISDLERLRTPRPAQPAQREQAASVAA